MEPQVSGQKTEPFRDDTEGTSAFLDTHTNGQADIEIAALDKMTDAELLAEAGIEPVVSTSEAAEYFDRTSQWIYWGLKPDPVTGEVRFVWPDDTPIVPDRIGEGINSRRRFTTPILRAILAASYRRGNITDAELKVIIRRIRYTELGVEWRQREGWKFANLGHNRHRWVKPENAYWDGHGNWRLRKGVKLDKGDKPLKTVTEDDFIDVDIVSVEED